MEFFLSVLLIAALTVVAYGFIKYLQDFKSKLAAVVFSLLMVLSFFFAQGELFKTWIEVVVTFTLLFFVGLFEYFAERKEKNAVL